MDLDYLVNGINDELKGSKEYIKIAIELKPMTESWSKKFYEMSVEEHKHAAALYSMFNEYCSKLSQSYMDLPEYVKDMRSEIVDKYSECTALIKSMWETYK